MKGWFKVYRDLWEKPIWLGSTPEQKVVLITLISMANHQEKQWEWQGQPYKLEPGQLITSLESIVKKCGKGVSVQNVRTSLKRLEKLGFLTSKPTNKNRLITLINWGFYQGSEYNSSSKLTSNQQADNNQLTTNKNEKKINNENNYFLEEAKIYDNASVPFNLANRLLKKIRNHHPEFKDPNLQKWSDDFNSMLESDLRRSEEVTYLIDWCQQDYFWKSLILSPTKLREKYDVLVIKSKAEKESKQKRNLHQLSLSRPSHWEEPTEVSQEELDKIRKFETELSY